MKLLIMLLMSFNVFAVPLSTLINPEESQIIANKANGEIYVYNAETRELKIAPALFGKTYSDVLSSNTATITPAGEYKTTKMYSTHLGTDITSLLKIGDSFLAIHPVYTGKPKQKRLERLASSDPSKKRITNGCINVPKAFYYDTINKLKNGTTVKVLMENETVEDNISGTNFLAVKEEKTQPLVPSLYNEVKSTQDGPLLKYDLISGEAGFAGLN